MSVSLSLTSECVDSLLDHFSCKTLEPIDIVALEKVKYIFWGQLWLSRKSKLFSNSRAGGSIPSIFSSHVKMSLSKTLKL